MAMERIIMAENLLTPPASIEQGGGQVASNFDLNRRDYQTRILANYVTWIDPQTGGEVARIPKIEGGSGGSDPKSPDWWPPTLEKIVPWESSGIKDKMDKAVLAMRHFYDMPNAERGTPENVVKFSAAYQVFSEYALGGKLYEGKDNEIITEELRLVEFDQAEIQKYANDPAKQGQITKALNKWDLYMREKVGIQHGHKDLGIDLNNPSTCDDKSRPPHISKEEWERYLARPDEIETQLAEIKQKLEQLISKEFVSQRETTKENVDKAVIARKEEIKEEDGRIGIQDWEEKLEAEALVEKETSLETDNPFADKSVEVILMSIKAGVNLEQANKALEWNFHQARKLGIFEDLEEMLDARYQQLALSLLSRRRVDQADADMETGRGSRKLTLAEVKGIIAKEQDESSPDSFSKTAELGASWEQLIRDGVVSNEQVNHFKGIRKAFVVGAYYQMYDSLSNSYKDSRAEEIKTKLASQGATGERIARALKPAEILRRSGEWNVEKQKREVDRILGAEQRADEDKLWYLDRYYLTLTGTTLEQVEQGVNNYLTNLLEGAQVYDVQTILQKMQYLSFAITSKLDALTASGMTKSSALAALNRINRIAENRGEFYVMDFAAQNLLMDEYFIPLYEKWGGVKGIEKMKMMLDMNNGLVAPCMLLFLDPKNRLLFQPAGFKGQGMNNIWAQRTLRDRIKGQIAEELVNYQAREANPTELMEQTNWQDFLRMKFTDRTVVRDKEGVIEKDEKGKIKRKPPLKEELATAKKAYETELKRVEEANEKSKATDKKAYETELKRVEEANEKSKATDKDLKSLRRVREEYVKQKHEYDRLLAEAKSAVVITLQMFNIFGETAYLGAPLIIMDNGDHISIEDVTYIYKFAIMDAMRKNDDSPAKMRWRAYQWTKKPGQFDGDKNPIVKDKAGNSYKLVKGLEDTGITQEEYDAFLGAAKNLRINGYNAVFESLTEKDQAGNPVKYTLDEIIKRNDVRPVQNNFIGNYKSARDIFANPTAIREAKKGRQPFIMKILKRLDSSGRGLFTSLDSAKVDGKPIDKVPAERLKEIFEDATTDSLIFHITVRQLARWEATRKPSDNLRGTDEFSSTDRIYYGGNEFPWGVKRLQYLAEYWMTNKRERIGRAWELLPFVPLLQPSLAQGCDAENLPDLIFNVNKEHIDEPGLKQFAAGYKDAQGWRHAGETSVDEQKGATSWSWWDKLTVDAAQMLKVALELPLSGGTSGGTLSMEDYIKSSESESRKYMENHPLYNNFKKQLVDITREVLKREAPLNAYLEAQLGYNRSAGGSGIGLEMGERWHYRVLEWWLSDKNPKGDRGIEGGLSVNSDAAQFFKFITIKSSWSEGISILDEAWRQARGTRDAGASEKFPVTVIL